MKASLDFRVLEWDDDGIYALRIQIFGTGPKGEAIDMPWTFDGLVTIDEVHRIVAQMNNGSYRPDVSN